MAKNKIDDLRDHLFLQLERLGDEELTGEDMDREIKRSAAIVDVAKEITASAMAEVQFIRATRRVAQTNLFKGAAPALELHDDQ